MEAGQLRHICRDLRSQGRVLCGITDTEDGTTYVGLRACQDQYGNSYGILSTVPDVWEEDGVLFEVAHIEPKNISALDDDAPIYMNRETGLYAFTDIELHENSMLMSRSYPIRQKTLPKRERFMFLGINVLQTLLFSAIGLIPVLFGAYGSVEAAYEAFRIDTVLGEAATGAIAMLSCLFVMLCGSGLQTLLSPKKQKDEFRKRQRQSPMGVIFQLPIWMQIVFFALTGIGEEVLFRLGVMSLLMSASLMMGTDIIVAALLALPVSSSLFALAHAGSYRIGEMAIVFVYGCVLGISWLVSGSLLVPIAAHALYDLTASLTQLPSMRKNAQAYFFGKRPNAMLSHKSAPDRSEDSYAIIF